MKKFIDKKNITISLDGHILDDRFKNIKIEPEKYSKHEKDQLNKLLKQWKKEIEDRTVYEQ
jgi:hypothetical protein